MTADKVTKEEWLQGALDYIVEEGVVGMTPERLARSLGTSRSSYYWHFGSQENFRERVIDYWAETYTDVVRELVFANEGAPTDRLHQLFELVHDGGISRYEGAVHALAYGNPTLMAKIDRAYRIRFDSVRSILSKCGVDQDKLDPVSRFLVCYLTWETAMESRERFDSMLDDRDFLSSLLN